MASSSSHGPPAKYRRLEQLRRSTPYVSQSALSAICQDIRENGLPKESSRPLFTRATKAILEVEYPYGPLKASIQVEALDGSVKTFPALNVKSYLAALFSESPSFKEVLRRTMASYPCSFSKPWGLILYMDEVNAGNVLAARATRKTWAIYSSILEFSLDELSQELSWFPVMHLRSSEVEKLQGGISQVFAAVIKSIFLDDICDPRLGLLLPGEPSLKIFLDLKVILQDGGSHKFCWSYRGDAALKPCLLCNLKADRLASKDDEDEVQCASNLKYSDLRIFTSEEILSSYDRLSDKKKELNKQDFLLWQKAVGKTYHPLILPLDKGIRAAGLLQPAEQFAHDWMHGTCSNGTFSVAAYELFAALPAVSWENFGKYLTKWHLPIHWSMNHLHELFDGKRIKKYKQHQRLQLQASEVLAILPIMVFWCRKMLLPLGKYNDQCLAFLAMAEVIFILSEGQMWGLASKELLLGSVEQSLALAAKCGWHLTPKFHWPLHMSDQLGRWGKLPSCFTCERKNKVVKKFATAIHNTVSFEQSLFQEIVAEELAKLKNNELFLPGPHLLNPHLASKKTAKLLASHLQCPIESILTSKEAKLLHGKCSKGDLVLLQSTEPQAAEVWMFCQLKNQPSIWALVQMLQLQAVDASTNSAAWKATSSKQFTDIQDIMSPLIYITLPSEDIRTLLPWHWCHKRI